MTHKQILILKALALTLLQLVALLLGAAILIALVIVLAKFPLLWIAIPAGYVFFLVWESHYYDMKYER